MLKVLREYPSRWSAAESHPVRPAQGGYNKKLFADNLDRLMGILQRNVERSYNLSPWFIFYDQALAPSWYNFQTHYLVRADPNNLTDPPIEEKDEEDEDEVTTTDNNAAMTAHQNCSRRSWTALM